jgi:hypothetical protein
MVIVLIAGSSSATRVRNRVRTSKLGVCSMILATAWITP